VEKINLANANVEELEEDDKFEDVLEHLVD
jgi:hypothetical protein